MNIGIAQIKSFKGDIEKSMARHIELIERAIDMGADALFFPELSITGYEPALAHELAVAPEDSRFVCFQELSDAHQITLGIGVPTIAAAGIHISMLIFQPRQARQLYSKRHLHADELPYFIPGESQLFMIIEDQWIAPAICYESLLESHAMECANANTTIYLASVAKDENGLMKAQQHFPKIAKKHNMTVLMANAIGPSDTFNAIGSSAIWDNQGDMKARLNDTEEGILLYNTRTEKTSLAQLP